MKAYKILIIPDIHGRTFWKDAINTNLKKYKKIIFLGDYLDSFNHTDKQLLDNLKSIIKFKKQNKDKVVLLLGNHELHYLDFNYRCSGFRKSLYYDANQLLKDNNIFDISYIHDDKFLFTHAGVIKTWLKEINFEIINTGVSEQTIEEYIRPFGNNISERLNNLPSKKLPLLSKASYTSGGADLGASPLWARPSDIQSVNFYTKEKENKLIEGYIQIVGHTPGNDIRSFNQGAETEIHYCDISRPIVLEVQENGEYKLETLNYYTDIESINSIELK